MEEQAYSILPVSEFVFEFMSKGKKLLLKQVRFSKLKFSPKTYNLSLGTVSEDGSVNFLDNSNNGDVVKIFMTVISCVKLFTMEFPEREIYFQGNTEQKNRVYNEILRRHYDEFSLDFNIFGLSNMDGNNTVHEFDRSENYSGFYLRLKSKKNENSK